MKRAAILLFLAGCTAAIAPETPGELPDTCGRAQFADLIGQDATVLERQLYLGMVRVIRPGDAVTQDFRPERINFAINEAERISGVTCG
ncbi:MAG: I78 family peptidase inhibitor [Pseudomonadota bacterium]